MRTGKAAMNNSLAASLDMAKRLKKQAPARQTSLPGPQVPQDDLPPGWVRVPSRSKPGAFYYAHKATNRTQVEHPGGSHASSRASASSAPFRASGATAAASSSSGRASDRQAASSSVSLAPERRPSSSSASLVPERRASTSSRGSAPERRDSEQSAPGSAAKVQAIPDSEAPLLVEDLEGEETCEKEVDSEEERQKEAELRKAQEEAQKVQEERRKAQEEAKKAQEEAKRKRMEEQERKQAEEDEAEEAMQEELQRKARERRARDLAAKAAQIKEMEEEGVKPKKEKKKKEKKKRRSSSSSDDIVTAEDIQKWKEEEDRKEREAIEAERRKKEEEAAEKRRQKEEEEIRRAAEAAEKARLEAEVEDAARRVRESQEQKRNEAELEKRVEEKRQEREDSEERRREKELEEWSKEAERTKEKQREKKRWKSQDEVEDALEMALETGEVDMQEQEEEERRRKEEQEMRMKLEEELQAKKRREEEDERRRRRDQEEEERRRRRREEEEDERRSRRREEDHDRKEEQGWRRTEEQEWPTKDGQDWRRTDGQDWNHKAEQPWQQKEEHNWHQKSDQDWRQNPEQWRSSEQNWRQDDWQRTGEDRWQREQQSGSSSASAGGNGMSEPDAKRQRVGEGAPPAPRPPSFPPPPSLLQGRTPVPPVPPAPPARPAPPAATESAQATGLVIWYNGRQQQGMIKADQDGKMLRIPPKGAPNLGLAPPVPGGLMHGTRVSYKTTFVPSVGLVCSDVRPLEGQVGLSCGGDSQAGGREQNEDRTAAVDLPDGLGHLVGVIDGHRGTHCADFLAQRLPHAVVTSTRERFRQLLATGKAVESLSSDEEVRAIREGLIASFEACDREFVSTAKANNWGDGASALIAQLTHGFQAEQTYNGNSATGTVPSAPGGLAKCFVAWCGTARMLLLRGRQAYPCTRDHVCSHPDEHKRLQSLGALLVQDPKGLWWMGRPDRMDLARQLQSGYEPTGPKSFSVASRGFGDIQMKEPPQSYYADRGSPPVLTVTPEVAVVDLTPADWAIVLGGRGVFGALSDQEVSDICLQEVGTMGKGPVEAARAVTARAMQRGARENLTCIVMRLGWVQPPTQMSLTEMLSTPRA